MLYAVFSLRYRAPEPVEPGDLTLEAQLVDAALRFAPAALSVEAAGG